jgi:hypothetical protein
MLDGRVRRRNHRLVRMFESGDVEGMERHPLPRYRGRLVLRR